MSFLPYNYDWKFVFQAKLGLRVHYFGRYGGYPEWSIPSGRNAADMVGFFFVEKSSCWAVINGRKLILNRGDLLVTSGADEFSYGHDPKNPHTSLTASLAVEQGSVVNCLLHRKFQRTYAWPNPDEFVGEFEKVMSALASNAPYRDFHVAGAVLQWLAYVMPRLRAPIDRSLGGDRGSVVDKILTAESWAKSRLNETITLADWSRAVGVNKVYFERIFKRETGQRPMEWLNQNRLEMACQYLRYTNKTVSEIANDCGYANQFYFSRIFRRKLGSPPSVYRRTHVAHTGLQRENIS
jgi:AraC-like DNA-binding protein